MSGSRITMLSRFLVVMGTGYLLYALYFVFLQAYMGAAMAALGAAAALAMTRIVRIMGRGRPSVALVCTFLASVIAVWGLVWINVTSPGSAYDPARREHAQNAR